LRGDVRESHGGEVENKRTAEEEEESVVRRRMCRRKMEKTALSFRKGKLSGV
jgi:hypothetical protein